MTHFQVELVDNKTGDVVVGFLELFTNWIVKNSSSTPLKRAQIQHRHTQVEAHGVKTRTSVEEPTTFSSRDIRVHVLDTMTKERPLGA